MIALEADEIALDVAAAALDVELRALDVEEITLDDIVEEITLDVEEITLDEVEDITLDEEDTAFGMTVLLTYQALTIRSLWKCVSANLEPNRVKQNLHAGCPELTSCYRHDHCSSC